MLTAWSVDLCNTQCVIKNETCSCQVNSNKTVYSIRCDNERSIDPVEFPHKEIQFEFDKYKSAVKELKLTSKNYPRITFFLKASLKTLE